MPPRSVPQLRELLGSDELSEAGLRLTKAFFKLRNAHERQRVIALAEQLLAEQDERDR